MIRLMPILLAVCATALALSGCLDTPNIPSAYGVVSNTNVSQTDAWNYCNRQSSSVRAPSTSHTKPKQYVINKGIGNTYYATETAAPQSAAGAFLGGLASGLAAGRARRNALESCMLQLG